MERPPRRARQLFLIGSQIAWCLAEREASGRHSFSCRDNRISMLAVPPRLMTPYLLISLDYSPSHAGHLRRFERGRVNLALSLLRDSPNV